MTVIARRVASVPVRTAVATWERVVEIVTAPESDAREELTGITSIAAMLIADEQTKDEARCGIRRTPSASLDGSTSRSTTTTRAPATATCGSTPRP